MFQKLLFSFLSVLCLSFILAPQVHASEYYSRDYAVTYTVKEDGMTNVSINVTLTNKTSDYYAVSDTITLSFSDIRNLTARDPDGPLKPVITKSDTGNDVESTFNKKVVGSGKSLVYNVTFDTGDIARHVGKIWEINIPGLSQPETIDGFTTEVKVPPSFGEPTYVKPAQADKKLVFTKEQLANSSISIAYGTEQIYSFGLVYHLQNKNVFPIKTEIALPPTTNYQEVSISSIEPKPTNITLDKDGNWMAQFQLTPAQKIDVVVRGIVKLSNIPRREVLSADDFATFTKEQPYWEINNSQIRDLARKLKTPKAIYDYVVENLQYDFNRVGPDQPRLGAQQALKRKNEAICLEFTDLFVALARAAGIPAREINGYAHTENVKQRPLSLVQDILHAWPEYYDKDKQTWVMVDPTWGNTTGGTDYFTVFDFDHITFVRKGISSTYPIPAGGYKNVGDEEKKDIGVQFGQSFPTDIPQVQLTAEFPVKVLSVLPIAGTVKITNTSSILFPAQTAVVTSSTLRPMRHEIHIWPIPPFGSVELPVSFDKVPLLTNRSFDFIFRLQDAIIQRRVTVTPFAFSSNQIIGGITVVLLSSIILIVAFKAWRLFIPRRA